MRYPIGCERNGHLSKSSCHINSVRFTQISFSNHVKYFIACCKFADLRKFRAEFCCIILYCVWKINFQIVDVYDNVCLVSALAQLQINKRGNFFEEKNCGNL